VTRPARIARLALSAAASAIATVALAAPSAQAGVLVSSATDCEDQVLEQPFTRWLDPMSYTLVRGGSFEDGAPGWTLGSASVVAGNESFKVRDAGDAHSLRIPAGRSVTSASICVGLDHPTMRFFARSEAGSLLGSVTSALAVEVLFEDAAGNVRSLPIGATALNTKWHPTLPLPVLANLLPVLPDERTAVAFRFRAVGGSAWRIDDVYVDPRSRR
jgi:hypothetical protein